MKTRIDLWTFIRPLDYVAGLGQLGINWVLRKNLGITWLIGTVLLIDEKLGAEIDRLEGV